MVGLTPVDVGNRWDTAAVSEIVIAGVTTSTR
jgi:hypothetical protein